MLIFAFKKSRIQPRHVFGFFFSVADEYMTLRDSPLAILFIWLFFFCLYFDPPVSRLRSWNEGFSVLPEHRNYCEIGSVLCNSLRWHSLIFFDSRKKRSDPGNFHLVQYVWKLSYLYIFFAVIYVFTYYLRKTLKGKVIFVLAFRERFWLRSSAWIGKKWHWHSALHSRCLSLRYEWERILVHDCGQKIQRSYECR